MTEWLGSERAGFLGSFLDNGLLLIATLLLGGDWARTGTTNFVWDLFALKRAHIKILVPWNDMKIIITAKKHVPQFLESIS